ncbi:spore protease YyaC [Clostridium brassicae]|uniref:Spore protease YyaC n=1 Tax=Clostridium brassicae TaxID=2999072 RepID=A0ABT4D917_9CLOT|nr:spore protease YyaC [Clostridium brassicae]MCY6958795.1 spore protease YyaC [Clostridium brassicae]
MNKIKVDYKDNLSYYQVAYFLKDYIDMNTLIVCIGTDRCIGDCLGPLVGTLLQYQNFPLKVYGTISAPIHALNIDDKLKEIKSLHPTSNIIGVDACLGDNNNIGEIQARNYPIHPGKGVGKLLPDVGESSIIGIVDSSDNNELFTNRNIRLDLVLNMAKVISHSLIHSYYMSCLKTQKF